MTKQNLEMDAPSDQIKRTFSSNQKVNQPSNSKANTNPPYIYSPTIARKLGLLEGKWYKGLEEEDWLCPLPNPGHQSEIQPNSFENVFKNFGHSKSKLVNLLSELSMEDKASDGNSRDTVKPKGNSKENLKENPKRKECNSNEAETKNHAICCVNSTYMM